MARRGGSRKGQTRRDAALDAMRSYGFPEELISSTIKELLDVYGMDGWVFIEEASYKVLLETILEKLEKEEEEKVDSSKGDGDGEKNTNDAGNVIPMCSNVEDMASSSQASYVAMDFAPLVERSECIAHPQAPEGEESGREDINVDQESKNRQMDDAEIATERNFDEGPETPFMDSPSSMYDVHGVTIANEGSFDGSEPPNSPANEEYLDGVKTPYSNSQSSADNADDVNGAEIANRVDLDGVEAPSSNFSSLETAVATVPSTTRKPCHGWLDSSDDEEDLVELTPALEWTRLFSPMTTRKQRWDIGPEDL